MPLNYALIGCGNFGMAHLKRLTSLKEIDLKWVVDRREHALDAARAKFPGLRYTTDYREMVADPDVEAVSIVTNIPSHHRLAIDCASAGKHILVEKPMTDSMENATAMVETAEKNGVKLMINQNYRWFSDVAAARQILEENDFGEVKFANLCFYQWLDVEGLQPSREEPHLDRCVIFCHGVHLVDLLRYLTGREAKNVSCLTQRTNPDFKGETTALMLLELEGDVPATMHLSFACKGIQAPGQGIHFYQFENGHLTIDVRRQATEGVLYGDKEQRFLPELEARDFLGPPIAHFVDCIRNDREPLTSGRDNLGTMRILTAAYESASKGGEVVRFD